MRHISVKALILIGVIASAGRAYGEGPTPEIPSDLILERFAVSKNGDALLVPVRVAEKDYLFVVDTGATGTVFDASLPLGQPVDVVTGNGSEGQVELKLYQPPDAKVGRTSLGPLDAVACLDLKSIRQVWGQPIQGILGMDFLGRYVVHIDIEKGELLLLKSAPKSAGVELPISWEPGELPFVAAEITRGERTRFLVDTGESGLDSGTLGILEIRSLVTEGQFREIGKALHESISGSKARPLFQGKALSIGGFAVHSPIFSESYGSHPNRLGLRFWSHFAATFDFPERKVYLRKSANFGRLDRWNATGLHLWKRGDSIEVAAVDSDSPADRAGLKKGDVLVELNGLNAAKTGLFDMRYALCNGGQLTCLVRRDSQERRLSITQPRQAP
jgi:hypothetical protein